MKPKCPNENTTMLPRAQGCLLGQLAGDALGSLETGVVDTVMRGGDTDTNAAICGALLGAVYGLDAVPAQRIDCILNCRPQAGQPGVHRPRPECFWPVDALELAEGLLSQKQARALCPQLGSASTDSATAGSQAAALRTMSPDQRDVQLAQGDQ